MDALMAYWSSLNGGATPLRQSFDPAAIKALLPYIYLTEISRNPFRVYYRYTGSMVDEWNGSVLAGHYMDEMLEGDDTGAIRILIDAYQRAADTGRPVFDRYVWPIRGGYHADVLFGIYPMVVDGVVSQCLSIEEYDPNPRAEDWLPVGKLLQRR